MQFCGLGRLVVAFALVYGAGAQQLMLYAGGDGSSSVVLEDYSAEAPHPDVKSGTKGLGENVWEDLEAAQYPEIVFRLEGVSSYGSSRLWQCSDSG